MDLGDLQNELQQVLGSNTEKATSKKAKSSGSNLTDEIVENVDAAVKSRLPKGAVTNAAESMLDQNKDGHIVDDLLRMGENLIKKKK